MTYSTCDYCGEEFLLESLTDVDGDSICPDCLPIVIKEDDDDPYCTACNGSGEGMYDGTRCPYCHGTGVESPEGSI